MDDLYIVMPAYNEEANIESVVSAWLHLVQVSVWASLVIVYLVP